MKKVIAMRWVEALRSKQYKQGRGQLRDVKNQFCCLGVLCNLHAQDNPKFAAEQNDLESYDDSSGYAPTIICAWAGLKTINGSYTQNGKSLAGLNDGGADFFEIADIIETHWRDL